ncbi:BON1-associated protein 2 [Ziziphus jujuba]|uniref:BON1-associated protein 2 n=1 Tax=Ziziphus jujuba TaxID=326968 RepID=A0ABM3IR26_ZIZJJ|nr:BON1-associated protein 2 [Ziziphus jujuba]
MAASTSRTIEVTVLSGEDLRMDRKPIKKNSFVVVRTENGDFRSTETDKEGSSFPIWKEKLVLDLPAHARALTLEVHCKTSSGSKVVGTAMVPVSDFVGGYVPESYLHFLSYRLRDRRGEKNGIINISVRMKVHGGGEYGCSSSCSVAAAASETIGVPVGETGFGGGFVTGVPVWCAYPSRHF